MVVDPGKRAAHQKGVADPSVTADAATPEEGTGQSRRSKHGDKPPRRTKALANHDPKTMVPTAPKTTNAPKTIVTDAPKTGTGTGNGAAAGANGSDVVVDGFYSPTEWDWLYGGGTPSRQDALFVLDVSGTLGEEYRPLFFDIARMVCIHTTIQLMAFAGGSVPGIFTSEFAEMLLYIIVGTMLFWLVLRKLVWLA